MVVAAERPRLILPGLAPIEPGVERYWVKGGGATVVALEGGDELTVIDLEGRQPAELTWVLPDGGEGAAAMGVRADAPAAGLATLVREGGEDAHQVLAALAARGLGPEGARALRVFGVVAAPGGSMRIDDPDPNPPSDLRVVVRRARPRSKEEAGLPPPLAAPLLDFQVDRASALSYEVKAGEYLQIIDLRGQQCSDFLAFNRRRLDDGVERGLDAVTTRTLMGSAYPGPGLYSKFYDQDMQPLVEGGFRWASSPPSRTSAASPAAGASARTPMAAAPSSSSGGRKVSSAGWRPSRSMTVSSSPP